MAFERLPSVKWVTTGSKFEFSKDPDDDFVFRYKGYCLRVEQMDSKYWWWCIYYKEEYLEFDDPNAKTMEQAMGYAEAGFYSHIISEMEK